MLFDLVDLVLFVNTAGEHNLTRGASLSHMSLPAASARIKNIEDRIGTKLFYRNSRGTTLTPAGQAFLYHGRLFLQQLGHLEKDLHEYAKGIKGHLRIFANTTAITEFLPRVLSKYLTTHPDVNVDLQERLSRDIVRALNEEAIEIGVLSGNLIRTDGLESIPYRRDRLVLVTATAHPLAQRETVSFAQTLEFDYIGLVKGTAIHDFLNQAAGLLGRSIKIRIQVGNFEALCRMVETNIGIGVIPESTARRISKTLAIKIIPLSDDWAVRNLQICVRNLDSFPTFARDLIDMLIADSGN
jgi:DNA-binding transcriptional LysR family regulator